MNHRKGTILILALWALTLLTVFAVNIGTRLQQKMTLLSRLERKAAAQAMAASAIRLVRARFLVDFNLKGTLTPGMLKSLRHNNPFYFANIPVGLGTANISYADPENPTNEGSRYYGLVDEESKININKADRHVLTELIVQVINIKEEDAEKMADAIVDWREYGESEIKGFYSDDFYENLEFPYLPKKSDFEVIEELQLVRGITPEIYSQLSNYVTIYGNGPVNVNTASSVVLTALGLEPLLAHKIIELRNGKDGKSATSDDYFFNSPQEIIEGLQDGQKLNARELAQLQTATSKGYLGGISQYFQATASATAVNQKTNSVISCVFRSVDGRIISWREY